MDNWGDPWADNADTDTTNPPTQSAATSAPAPNVLKGFLVDDAGWGNDDAEFGHAQWDKNATNAPKEDAYGTYPSHRHHDTPVSESSDSSTTIQAEHAETGPVRLPPDDDSSARPSTSPSEASHSHVDVTTDSSRTSYEEDNNTAGVSSPAQHEQPDGLDDTKNAHDTTTHATKDQDEATASSTRTLQGDASSSQRELASTHVNTFVIDQSLLSQMFPLGDAKELDQAPDDPIYSTSARKAWYRLTRKQTLREYNHGNADNNHVRVNWANSEIRNEVNEIVGRWAREDRISGTGPGARASFYWDSPMPVDFKLPSRHTRHQSAMPTTSAAPLANRQSLPPLSTRISTAFDWSSPSNSIDAWHQHTPSTTSTASPTIRLKHPAVMKVQRQEGRAASLDLTSRGSNQTSHARSMSTSRETPVVARLIPPPPISTTPTNSLDLWAGLDSLDTATKLKETTDVTADGNEDEDDWGEMVSTPTVSTFNTSDPFSQVAARNNNTVSTSAITTPIVEAAAPRDQSPDTMHASPKPIARLRSAISPTSALFKSNAFIPLGAEQGPIGPGILKPTKRTVSSASQKQEELVPAMGSETDPKPHKGEKNADNAGGPLPWGAETSSGTSKDFISYPTQTTEPNGPLTPTTQTRAPTMEINMDSWANADFSIFESTASPTLTKTSSHHPSDPFSAFDSAQPHPPTPPASIPKPFAHSSPPRNICPPTLQPLTGATSSAQQRKAEEDGIIREIVAGLPDLRYMLGK